MKSILRFCCLFIITISYSQTTNNQQKIITLLGDYFNYERESIYVQFNKTIYVNNEDIAFKGYIINPNSNTPNVNTTNIQLVIYNDKHEPVQKQLLYASNGTFDGNLRLNKKFNSGIYYFHFYTNWMNNFKEDNSFTQKIEIIDQNEIYSLKSTLPDLTSASVKIFPESGKIVDGVINTIGVQLRDCNQTGIAAEGIIVDSKSNEITSFSTNSMGNAMFNIIPELGEKYFLKINSNKINILKQLPQTQPTGLIISYNNYLPNTLIVNIKTNSKGIEEYKNKKLTLLVHQNKIATQTTFSLDENNPNPIIRFEKQLLANGVNSIRILDENLNQVAERLVFNDPNQKVKINLEVKSNNKDTLSLLGQYNAKQAKISLSILPAENACTTQKNSILGTFLLNNYLETPENNNFTYFDLDNSSRKQDIELLMLNQEKGKYQWENILTGAPKINYKFRKGVTISGMVDKKLNPNNKYKVTLFSIKSKVWEETNLNQNNKFQFENFYAKDSTAFLFQLSGDKDNSMKSNIFAHVVPSDDQSVFNPNFDTQSCPSILKTDTTFNFKKTIIDNNAIELSSVVVTNKNKKEVFLHKDNSDNINATAYKIENQYGSILNFLNSHGFKAGLDENNSVTITSNRNIMQNGRSPDVFIDDIRLFTFDPLFNLFLEDVDEIYIDKVGFLGSTGSEGIIKIYLKPNTNKDFYNPKFSTLIVTSGFTKSIDYKNSFFENTRDFNYFGSLKWEPNISETPDQTFEVKFVNNNQNAVQVSIEGFTPEGQLISEIKKVILPSL